MTNTPTPEQEEQVNADIKKAQLQAIKVMKRFAEMLLKLPDEFEFEQKPLDELLKPIVEELYKDIIEFKSCQQDIKSAIDLMGVLTGLSLNRCKNQTRNALEELYKQKLGYHEPEVEMPIQEILLQIADANSNKV